MIFRLLIAALFITSVVAGQSNLNTNSSRASIEKKLDQHFEKSKKLLDENPAASIHQIDSLIRLASSSKKNDYLIRGNFLKGDYYDEFLRKPDSAISYYKVAQKINQKINTRFRFICNTNIGSIYRKKGQSILALPYYKDNLNIVDSLKVLSFKITTYAGLANTYNMLGKLDSSIYYCDLGIQKLGKEHGAEIARLYKYKGLVLVKKTEHNDALENLKTADSLFALKENIRGRSEVLLEITKAYYSMMENKLALQYGKRAYDMMVENNFTGRIPYTSIIYANVKMDNNDTVGLEKVLKDGIALAEKSNSTANASTLKSTLGVYYVYAKDYEKAEGFIKQAIDFYLSTRTTNNLFYCYNDYLRCVIKSKNYTKAIGLVDTIVSRASEIEANSTLVEMYKAISEVYNEIGDATNAYKYLTIHVDVMDKIGDEEFSSEMMQYQAQYGDSIKTLELELARANELALIRQNEITTLESNRKDYVISSMSVGIIFIIGFGGYFLWSNARKKKQEAKIARQEKQIEYQKSLQLRLKALRSQLNPHFIFNSLNSIQLFMQKNEVAKTSDYLAAFSRLMRNTLDSSEEQYITLEDEIAMLKDYLKLEQLRMSDKFDFEIEFDDDIVDSGVPPMLLQPYVENAIWHGISNSSEERGKVKISFGEENGSLVCSVEDNGIGRDAASKLNQNRKHKSHSTRINQARMDLLNAIEDNKIQLHIIDKLKETGEALGTLVQVRLPIDLAS